MNRNELDIILARHQLWLLTHCQEGEKANLDGANLERFDLSDANLSQASIRGAKLRYSNLNAGNFRDSDLEMADLRETELWSSIFTNAEMPGVDLRGASMRKTYLNGANLQGADLTGARLQEAYFYDADLAGAKGLPPVPVIPNIDRAILNAINREGNTLDMNIWYDHDCGTTQCRAGWAITLAGEEGKALQQLLGYPTAAALIYRASRKNPEIPNWEGSEEEVMASLIADAEKEEANQ